MEIPKPIKTWALGLLLGAIGYLAGSAYLATSSDASQAKDINHSQDIDIAIIKARLDWQSEALKMLLKERGLVPPPPK